MNVPKLRFQEFTGEWEAYKLADFAVPVKRKNKDNVSNLPLTISSLDGLVDQRDYFNRVVASKDMSNYYLLLNGEFAYNKSYSAGFPLGSIKRLDKYEKGALSSLYICFALDEQYIDSDYATCYFDSDKWYKEVSLCVAEGARNHGLLNVSNEEFYETKHFVPLKEEQNKISTFLKLIYEKIDNQKAIIESLEKQKKALMQKIFSQELRFKDDDGKDFPAWEEKKFGEVVYSFDYGMGAASCDYDGENKYIRITDIDDLTHKYTYDDIVSPNGELDDKYLVGKNNILFARTGASTGKTYLYDEKDGKMYFAGFLIRGKVKEEYNSYFVYNQTLISRYKKWVSIESIRSGQPGINAEQYKDFIIVVPCLKEQNKIAEFLKLCDAKIEVSRKELEGWQQIKKGLLQQMFV